MVEAAHATLARCVAVARKGRDFALLSLVQAIFARSARVKSTLKWGG